MAVAGDVVLAQSSRDHRRAAAVGVLARQALGQPELPRPAEIIVRIDATIHGSDALTDDSGASAGLGLDGACIPGGGTAIVAGEFAGHRADGRAAIVGEPGAGEGLMFGGVPGVAVRGGRLMLSPAAEVQGWGAVLVGQLGDLLDGCKVTVRPVIDARRLVPVPGYEVPDTMRLAVTEWWPVDAFPFGTLRSTACDLDHSTPYGEGGRTEVGNLAPLKRFAHRVRTHGGWKVEQPEPGRLTWTSPHGYTYAVTPAGTLRIGRPPPSAHDWWNQEPPDWLAE